jgi:DnaJ-class molecular chaperone
MKAVAIASGTERDAVTREERERLAKLAEAVIAPTCPDCGQPCRHPLTMPVDCPRCKEEWRGNATNGVTIPDGRTFIAKEKCPDCHGAGKVAPPPPTDEQIFGRECERCAGRGKNWTEGDHYLKPDWRACLDCNGTGRVGAAENLWVCLGTRWKPTCSMFSACSVEQHYCEGAAVPCGRTGVGADEPTWTAWKRAMRTRTKTTVLLDGHVSYGREPYAWRLRGPGDMETQGISLYTLMPDGTQNLKGRRTIVVTFEPEDEK